MLHAGTSELAVSTLRHLIRPFGPSIVWQTIHGQCPNTPLSCQPRHVITCACDSCFWAAHYENVVICTWRHALGCLMNHLKPRGGLTD